MVLAQMSVPDVVDVGAGVHALIVQLGGVALVAIGGALAFMIVRKGMRWACLSDGDCADGVSLAIEQSRIRRRYEKAMLAGNCHIAGYWASRYEDIWGEEASAEMQSEVNEEHQLWKR